MNTRAIHINEINEIYGFRWAIPDFIVVGENYPYRIINRAFRVDGYILAICLQGEIAIEINGVVYNCRKKNVLITKPLHLMRLMESSDDCRVFLIVFSKRFLITNGVAQSAVEKLQFSQVNASPVLELSQSEAWSIEHEFKGIWDRAREISHPSRIPVVGNLLMILLHDLDALCKKYSCLQETHQHSRGAALAIEFSALVQRHFRQRHDVAFYAQELHVTPKYLSSIIKENTGKTASALIAEAIAIEAQVLIRQANVSVKEASTLLHFPDQSTFGKFFKRSVGISPVEYRKQA